MKRHWWTCGTVLMVLIGAMAYLRADPVDGDVTAEGWGEDAEIFLSVSHAGDAGGTTVEVVCAGERLRLKA